MLDPRKRYLQIAFNYDLSQAYRILPLIPFSESILIEAGTPFIKREGIRGIRQIASMWEGTVVADLKTLDGAASEVDFIVEAGATAATALGSAPAETLNYFIAQCDKYQIISMIDMLGVAEPLKTLMKLKAPPEVVVIHKGRDEEGTRGKVIEYKHINKVRSKFDVYISVAGGLDMHSARSAIFNGADIIVANIVTPQDPWSGIQTDANVAKSVQEFLATIE